MYSKQALILFITLITISLWGIYYKNVNSEINHQEECDLNVKKCTFLYEKNKINVSFLSPIVTEEEILLSIDMPQELKLSKAWIEGANMFMGETPIIKEELGYVTFLGSCNMAKMQWRLNLHVEDQNGQVKTYSAAFYTINR
ncbi:MAG: hypothetical protein ACI9MS_000248 [Glaciecola sp.]|jgi:hypothetical protein